MFPKSYIPITYFNRFYVQLHISQIMSVIFSE